MTIRALLASAVLALACGGPSAGGNVVTPDETPSTCSDPAPLYTLGSNTRLSDHPGLGLPDTTLPEGCDGACLRAGEARLGLDAGALDGCGGGDEICAPSWLARVVHVQPEEGGRCAFAVIHADLAYETPIGIEVPLAARYTTVEMDPDRPGEIHRLESELEAGHPDLRIGPTFGDLDGDGRADWLHTYEVASERCFGSAFDTNECQGYGVPASYVVRARGERGPLSEPFPFFGTVSTPALTAALDHIAAQLDRCDASDDECPETELGLTWRGRRARGRPVARRIEGGFAIDQVVEEVDCDEACVTPLGDVCTESPSAEYGLASTRCRSLGVVLESQLVRADGVERQTRPAPDGTVAHIRCSDGCSMEALLSRLGDGDPTLHTVTVGWEEGLRGQWRSDDGALALPTGLFTIQVRRSEEAAPETWLVTIDAETGDLTL